MWMGCCSRKRTRVGSYLIGWASAVRPQLPPPRLALGPTGNQLDRLTLGRKSRREIPHKARRPQLISVWGLLLIHEAPWLLFTKISYSKKFSQGQDNRMKHTCEQDEIWKCYCDWDYLLRPKPASPPTLSSSSRCSTATRMRTNVWRKLQAVH